MTDAIWTVFVHSMSQWGTLLTGVLIGHGGTRWYYKRIRHTDIRRGGEDGEDLE